MPKLIDHEQRNMTIADALFDALREGGIENVTLSSVAVRAGPAIGSVRHLLGTREQMVGFAFDTMAEHDATKPSCGSNSKRQQGPTPV